MYAIFDVRKEPPSVNRDNAVDCCVLCGQKPDHWRAGLWFAILLLPISLSAPSESTAAEPPHDRRAVLVP